MGTELRGKQRRVGGAALRRTRGSCDFQREIERKKVRRRVEYIVVYMYPLTRKMIPADTDA